MEPAPTDDELLLRDAAVDLLAALCSVGLLRAHAEDITAARPLWDELREFVPLGLGPLTELCVLMTELGAVAAPTPFFATACLYVPLLDATGEHDLDPVLDGHASGTVALADADGRATAVPDVVGVDLVAAVDPAGTVTLLVEPPAVRTPTEDPTRCLYEVRTRGTGIPAGTVTPAELARVLDRARVALAAERAGTARALLDLAGATPADRTGLDRAVAAVRRAAVAADTDGPDRHDLAVAAHAAATTAAAGAARGIDSTTGRAGLAEFLGRRARAAGPCLDPPA